VFDTLAAIVSGPWASRWAAGNTVDSCALLLTASLGAFISFRAGLFNLGGEGQIYCGGIAAAAVLEAFPSQAGFALALVCAVFAGSLPAAFCGLLRKKTGADCMITTFLLSAALTPALDALVSGPLRDSGGSLLATISVPEALLLPRLVPPSALSVSAPIAVVLAAALSLFLRSTAPGYRFRISGASPALARFAGLEPASYTVPAMALSGALFGNAGFFALTGTYGRAHLGFPGGLGWSAIALSLAARGSALALVPLSLLFAAIVSGADSALLSSGLTIESSPLLQALVLAAASLPPPGARFRVRKGGI